MDIYTNKYLGSIVSVTLEHLLVIKHKFAAFKKMFKKQDGQQLSFLQELNRGLV